MKILIKNGRVVSPADGLDGPAHVLIEDGKIAAVGTSREIAEAVADRVIDATGKVVTPGLIDMHTHLREPGKPGEETIASGAAAAVAGGFTSVAAMPNTEPACDNEAAAEFVYLQAGRANLANVFPIGAVTKGRAGKELAEIGQLSQAGAVAFSDDGDSVVNAAVMRCALQYARMFDRPIISHCEDRTLTEKGVMNESFVSTVLGLTGMPAAAEEIMVNRDIRLAELTGGKLHIAHVSTRGSVELVRRAKARGVRVTAEATPHHFTLTDECVRTFDPNFKMNPPLREAEDVAALREALRDGTIDAIASDHAPHAEEEKELEFSLAPFGVIGMESSLAICISELVESGLLTWPQLVELMAVNPARILGLKKGTLAPGADADVTIIDPKARWTIDARAFRSKSRNCPFHGRQVVGWVVCTIVRGEVRFELGR